MTPVDKSSNVLYILPMATFKVSPFLHKVFTKLTGFLSFFISPVMFEYFQKIPHIIFHLLTGQNMFLLLLENFVLYSNFLLHINSSSVGCSY